VIKLPKYDLTIEPSYVQEKIVEIMTDTLRKRENKGCLVIFSGQNDSFVSAQLTIKSVGMESVKLLIISDVTKSRRQEISSIATDKLDFPEDRIVSFDINKVFNQFESVDELFFEGITGVPVFRQHNISHLLLRSKRVQKIIEEKTFSHIGKSQDTSDAFFRELIAYSKVRKRLKAILAYLIAERENLLLVSKTNKTEYATGLYTIFGYGHAADIMPLGDLYRTQALQLSEYLRVPQEIRDIAHTDIMPGVVNKYQYFFELDSNNVDKILIRLEASMKIQHISEELKIPEEKVERVNHFYNVSKLQKQLPVIPYLNE
jgi:NAD+ synthase